jgi:ABC-type transporter Mla subunit MlaD
MATQRQTTGNRMATRTEQPPTAKLPARSFPIQRAIQQLSDNLDALNERITELEQEGHRGHAMEVLKANALDFARRIDELRCVLIVVPTKAESRKPRPSKS